jgi:hypothetical protein
MMMMKVVGVAAQVVDEAHVMAVVADTGNEADGGD